MLCNLCITLMGLAKENSAWRRAVIDAGGISKGSESPSWHRLEEKAED